LNLFGSYKLPLNPKRSALDKALRNAAKAIDKANKVMNKIKTRDLACSSRAQPIPRNATIRREYVKCGKVFCEMPQDLTTMDAGKITN